jgi:Flp pilus assembly pilin Flp
VEYALLAALVALAAAAGADFLADCIVNALKNVAWRFRYDPV